MDVAAPVADALLVAEALGTDPFHSYLLTEVVLWEGSWKPKKLEGEDVAPGEQKPFERGAVEALLLERELQARVGASLMKFGWRLTPAV